MRGGSSVITIYFFTLITHKIRDFLLSSVFCCEGAKNMEETFMIFDRHNLVMGCQLIYTGVFLIILVVFYDD